MNPMDMMQIAGRLGTFNEQHPKFGLFLKSVAASGLEEGTILEVKVKKPDGQEYVSNIKMTREDVETVEMIKNLGKNQ
ncbi:MAG: hypothetical protein K6E10_03775 [Eubacterium sp.]|nr:hypothetical protein [Eubacterium sp.]